MSVVPAWSGEKAHDGLLPSPVSTTSRGLGEVLGWVGDRIFVLGLLLGLLFVLDPTEQAWGEDYPAIKYLPVAIAVAATPWLLPRVVRLRSAPAMFWLLAAGTLWVLAGALYTVGIQSQPAAESVMGRALGMLTLLPGFLVMSRSRSREFATRCLWLGGLPVSFLITLGLVVWQIGGIEFVDRAHIYHEQIFLPASAAAALFWSRSSVPGLRATTLVVLALAGVISLKNTGFIATAAAFGIVVVALWRSRGHTPLLRATRNAGIVLAITTGLIVAAVAALSSPESLPDGTPELRLVTYASRLATFLESPIYGTGFVGSPFMELGPRMVQSHSDLLDIAHFGGVLGLLVLALPMGIAALRVILQTIRAGAQTPARHIFTSLLFPFVLVAMLVNPIWHQPTLMFLLWTSVAFHLGEPGANAAPTDSAEGR